MNMGIVIKSTTYNITDGAAYTLGRMNRDCWYLYTMDEVGVTQPDQTVEISFPKWQ